jgi:hypothetical protein
LFIQARTILPPLAGSRRLAIPQFNPELAKGIRAPPFSTLVARRRTILNTGIGVVVIPGAGFIATETRPGRDTDQRNENEKHLLLHF